MSDFSDWLAEELNDKGWKKIELVNRSGLSKSYTYEIINGNVIPGVAACLAISRALNVSVETVVKQLGIPEKKSEFTEWIEDQINEKGLKKSELINRSGLESTYANNIIGGNLKPNITACRAIARL